MLIGTMNHPGRDVLEEIAAIGGMGFDFIDLTLEPPLATPRRLDTRAVRAALEDHKLSVVGHTAYYLPLCSPFESIRRAAVEELKLCLETFAAVGAEWMNIHPDRQAPLHDRKFIIDRNLQTIRELLPVSHEFGVGIMVENLPGSMDDAKLKPAVEMLLTKYPPEAVAIYLNAFNDMNEANWSNLKTILESDSRLQLGTNT